MLPTSIGGAFASASIIGAVIVGGSWLFCKPRKQPIRTHIDQSIREFLGFFSGKARLAYVYYCSHYIMAARPSMNTCVETSVRILQFPTNDLVPQTRTVLDDRSLMIANNAFFQRMCMPTAPEIYQTMELQMPQTMEPEMPQTIEPEIPQSIEPILDTTAENSRRFTLFPVDPRYKAIWHLYKSTVATFWTVDEVNLDEDVKHYQTKLTAPEKQLLDMTLAFFAAADGIVGENIASNFLVEVQVPEARAMYANQIFMETVHQEMYGIIIERLLAAGGDRTEMEAMDHKAQLFRGFDEIPAVRRKAQFALKYFSSEIPFAQRLIAFLLVEGVFFSASFCSIFWFKTKGLLPGVIFSNELIARDEAGHCMLSVLLYQLLENKLPETLVHEMVAEALEIEREFVTDAVPENLPGFQRTQVNQYVHFVANHWLQQLGYKALPDPMTGRSVVVRNPFVWMDMISLPGKGDFFAVGISEYSKPESGAGNVDIARMDF